MTEIADLEGHDNMVASIVQALDAAVNLHVRHSPGSGEPERPTWQETDRPVLLPLVRSGRVQCSRINYSQYDHVFAKDTCVRTTVL